MVGFASLKPIHRVVRPMAARKGCPIFAAFACDRASASASFYERPIAAGVPIPGRFPKRPASARSGSRRPRSGSPLQLVIAPCRPRAFEHRDRFGVETVAHPVFSWRAPPRPNGAPARSRRLASSREPPPAGEFPPPSSPPCRRFRSTRLYARGGFCGGRPA